MNVDDLWDRASPGRCWAAQIDDPDLAAWVRAVEARIAEKDRPPVWTRVAEAARERGVDRSDSQVINHFKGSCRCRK